MALLYAMFFWRVWKDMKRSMEILARYLETGR